MLTTAWLMAWTITGSAAGALTGPEAGGAIGELSGLGLKAARIGAPATALAAVGTFVGGLLALVNQPTMRMSYTLLSSV